MLLRSNAYTANGEGSRLYWPFFISLMGHLLLFGLIFLKVHWEPSSSYTPSVIDVQMVELSDMKPVAAEKSTSPEKAAPVEKKTEKVPEETPPAEPQVSTENHPEVSIAPPKPKIKTALKYKTFKSQKVLKKALQRLENKVEAAPERPLEDTIKRLKEKVEQTEKKTQTSGAAIEGKGTAATGAVSAGQAKEAELIDYYRLEVAYQIQKNWAFAEQLAGGDKHLMASIEFKVMPDGKITDIFFTDRSGNAYLDDSAYKAIVKSSPVKPHPEGLKVSFVLMGLRFTPEGVH
jgi:colicin import membrane protein